MRVLVTGATGNVGRNRIERLLIDESCRGMGSCKLRRYGRSGAGGRHDVAMHLMTCALDNPPTRRQLPSSSMDRPVDYGELAAYLRRARSADATEIPGFRHSVWMDSAKARFAPGWQAGYDVVRL